MIFSFKILIKRNAAEIHIRTYFQVNGRGGKDKKLLAGNHCVRIIQRLIIKKVPHEAGL
jgi:hypothetical protein